MKPETKYARSGGVSIAYQVVGDGPFDLVWVPGFVSHLEAGWPEPQVARFFRRLTSFCRLIRFDKRGTGLSDPLGDQHLEQWVDDMVIVMEEVGSERAAVFGISGGGPPAMLFAATYPERTSALVIYASDARVLWAEDYPWGHPPDEWEIAIEQLLSVWGTGQDFEQWAPTVGDDKHLRQWWGEYLRLSASPGAALSVLTTLRDIDIRHVLPAISAPTLVLHKSRERIVKVEFGRYLAQNIPEAKYVEMDGDDHLPYFENPDELLDEIEEFLTGARSGPGADRLLATVLFTDIVSSTESAASRGDRRWSEILETHDSLMKREIDRFRGRQVKHTGDGVLATFDGPARAIRCAAAMVETVRRLGIEIRAGLHTGEIEVAGEDVRGIAVNIAERVLGLAEPREVLVSQTVRDLVVGSGITFDDRGARTLKGVPGEWRLFAAEGV